MSFANILTSIMLVLLILSLGFILTVVPYVEGNNLDKFCQEQGYDKGDYGMTIFQESYCLTTINNTLIKNEVDTCSNGEGYCFVERNLIPSSDEVRQ